jgi:hypothetical protein
MSTPLRKIAAKAKQDPQARFTSLAPLLPPEFLRETWRQLNRKGASGIDGETLQEFATHVEARRQALGRRLRAGQSHAPAVRRVEMPKGTGTTRPLGIPMGHAYCISLQRRLGIAVMAPTSMNAIDQLTQYNELGVADQVSSGKNRSERVRITSNRSGLLTSTPTACFSLNDGLVGQTLMAVQSCHARRRYSWPFTS